MAKKKRNTPAKSGSTGSMGASAAAPASWAEQQASTSSQSTFQSAAQAVGKSTAKLLALPAELGSGDWTAIILAMMFFLTPTLGVPNELMLQDTLKSIIVAFMTLGAALILFWSQRNRREAFRWHAIIWLPVMLCAYSLGSMVWSHTYLAGVEAIRWFIFALIVWLTLNCLTRERFPMLAWGVHLGALGVVLLGASQFWFDNRFIPQGPAPAATFVNRNFAAEFIVCTVPFSAYLLFNERKTAILAFLAPTAAFHLVFLMMCGTRSALVAAFVALPLIAIMAWLYRSKLSISTWQSGQRIVCIGLFIATFVGLGLIKTALPISDFTGKNAFERGFSRAAQIQLNDNTFNVRKVMWAASQRMIQLRPLTGVGAGAWEVDLPLYQLEGSQLETDYYAHNEFLQILAEFGLAGWIFLLGMTAYSVKAAWRTLRDRSPEGLNEGPIRAVALISLLALMIVSNIGFPWRLAATGAIFAMCLGVLAASDARLAVRGILSTSRLPWRPAYSQAGAVVTMACLALATYITHQAAECEKKIVSAVKMALTISQSGNPNSPKNEKTKAEMLQLAREGIAINPHYRKITPMLGDELAKWGDWKNAVWVWESVVESRPYVVAMMSNIARGKAQIGDVAGALLFLEKAKKIQPKAVAVRSLEVILLSRNARESEALVLAKQAFADNTLDIDMMNAAHILGVRANDFKFAVMALETRNKAFPEQKVDGLLKIAGIELNYTKDEGKALAAFREAYAASGKSPQVLAQVPEVWHAKL
jgi:O-antigen ligase